MGVTAATGAGTLRLRPAQRASIYVLEARAQFLSLARTPAFTIPTLVFPLMFYVFFGVVMGFSPTAPTYLLATYGVFGLIGPALFGFGVGFATERDSGALLLKQTTPMPAAAYLVARVAAALVFGIVIVTGLFLLGAFAADVALYRWQWMTLAGIVLSSVVPFCALGLAVGAWVKAQAAVAIVNLIYLPMAFLSGLWMPISLLPGLLQDVAIVFPAYHQAQLALKVLDMDEGVSAGIHVAIVGVFTMVFLVIAAIGFRRVSQRQG
jgi:ABC-2 type transport system permease protein